MAKQQTQMRNAIYQNHLALDYLLASEGGICGKLNLSNCCLQINDEGKIIEEITDRIRKVAHVPVEIWKGWSPSKLFGGWFSTSGGFKILIYKILLILGMCLILPCLASLVLRSITALIGTFIEKTTAPQVLLLWKYQPLDQDEQREDPDNTL